MHFPALRLPLALLGFVFLGSAAPVSPHETVSGTVGAAKVTVSYGRPYLKGRTIGKDIVPYGHVWRLGADEATKLTTDTDLMIGTLSVPKGSYALYTMPSERGWKLIVNKNADQWGTAYDENKTKDLGQTAIKTSKAGSPVEQLTLSIEPDKLRFMWGTVVGEVPLRAK